MKWRSPARKGTSFHTHEVRNLNRWKNQWRTIMQFGDGVCFLGISAIVSAFGLKRIARTLRWQRVVDTLISRGAWSLVKGYAG